MSTIYSKHDNSKKKERIDSVINPIIEDKTNQAIPFYQLFYDHEDFFIETGEKLKWRATPKSKEPILKIIVNSNNNESFDFNGDVIFNLTNSWSKQHFDLLSDSTENKKLMQTLTTFPDVLNISLLLQTGAMNNAKQAIGSDRGDTFFWALNQFFCEESEIIMNHATANNGPYLRSFLEYFIAFAISKGYTPRKQIIYYYCYIFYNLEITVKNEKLIDQLIESGSKAIDTEERVKEYLQLVIAFFKARNIAVKKIEKRKRQTILS